MWDLARTHHAHKKPVLLDGSHRGCSMASRQLHSATSGLELMPAATEDNVHRTMFTLWMRLR
eukprot:6951346-Ditylum_brightwellii.AAC.1